MTADTHRRDDAGPREEHIAVDRPIAVESPAGRGVRWRWMIPLLVIAGAAGVWWMSTASQPTDDAAAEAASVPRATSAVVQTDLVSETAYAGTLGRADGELIPTRVAGTITAAAEAGETVAFGDALFEVDGSTVVLLEGGVPAWRSIGLIAEAQPVTNNASGTVTSIVAEGTVVEQGDVIYEVDGEPVTALYGDVPAHRTLREDVDEGADVLQLEQALSDLGYDTSGSMTIDEDYTAFTETLVETWQDEVGSEVDGVVDLGEVVFIAGPTLVTSVDVTVGQTVTPGQALLTVAGGDVIGTDVHQLEMALSEAGFDPGPVDGSFSVESHGAVVAWQESLGVDADGVVDLGEVVFLPVPVRVSGNPITVGGSVQAGSSVLEVTSEDTVVLMDLPAEDQGAVTEGMTVMVELPDATEVPAVVTSVASVATVSAENSTVFAVTAQLEDPAAGAGLEEAPVDVLVVTDSVQDVIAVPVASLLALAEGGYAVEVDDGGGATRLVAVEPGFFADGFVEVSGADLEPGDLVVMP